jgi:acyl-CoA synthetase (AMP-forming)/AMP-acid ligase II
VALEGYPHRRAQLKKGPDLDLFDAIWQPVAWWAAHRADLPALCEGAWVLSYGELDARVISFADCLRGAGVVPGDRVLIVGENSIAMAVAILGSARLGAWAIPVNARLSSGEMDGIRDHAGPRVGIYTFGSSPEAGAHGARHGAEPVTELADLSASLARFADAHAPVDERASAPGDRVAAMIYTSGTTGMPKGVMLTHDNLLFVAGRSGQSRQAAPGDRIFGVLPFSHVFGLASVFLGNMYGGARVDLYAKFAADEAVAAIESGDLTIFNGVPQMYARILEHTTLRGSALNPGSVRYLSSGGAPLDLGLKERVEAAFGVALHNGYGLTETSPTVTVTEIARPRSDETVGEVLQGVSVRIADDLGNELMPGQVGEIWVAGRLVMKGYYRAEAETAAVFRDEGAVRWFTTGDIGRIRVDAETGEPLLYVVGRKKELIIRSGFNVYPPEVEGAILRHRDVALCAVIGRPSKDGNEDIIAFVQPMKGRKPAIEDLAAFVKDTLSPYKRPNHWVLRETLPATAAGKILKHRLSVE